MRQPLSSLSWLWHRKYQIPNFCFIQITHEEEAFLLLKGEAKDKIRWRLTKEEQDRLKLARAKGDQEADATRLKALKAYGQWVPYADKMGGGIFYYNKVPSILLYVRHT